MRTIFIYLTLALCILPLWLCPALAGENRDTGQDKLIEALMERIKRLEAIVGEDERPITTKPAMGERLDRIEQELRKNQREAKQLGYYSQHDLQQLSQELQKTSRRIDELTARMDRADREADAMPGADDLRRLRRDVEGLQRQLDNLTQKLGDPR